jgi:hypothetical protein
MRDFVSEKSFATCMNLQIVDLIPFNLLFEQTFVVSGKSLSNLKPKINKSVLAILRIL